VYDDLRALRFELKARVRAGWASAAIATEYYNRVLAEVVRNPSAMEVDDREYLALKCRRCGWTTNAPRNDDAVQFYSCRCTPTVKRTAYIDAVGPDGRYIVDPDSLPIGA
jgi:hypothetical protein